MTRGILITASIAALVALAGGCKDKAKPEGPAEPPAMEAAAAEETASEAAGKEPSKEAAAEPPAAGKKAVMVIACKDFRDEELAEPRKALEQAGVKVTLASTSKEGCKGMLGAEVTPDVLVGDIVADDYDALILVGGTGSASLYEDEKVLELARAADEDGLVIGAICLAPGILARAGVLDGLRATAYDAPMAREALETGGAKYTGDSVTVDGVVVTGNGPEAAEEFGRKLVEILK